MKGKKEFTEGRDRQHFSVAFAPTKPEVQHSQLISIHKTSIFAIGAAMEGAFKKVELERNNVSHCVYGKICFDYKGFRVLLIKYFVSAK